MATASSRPVGYQLHDWNIVKVLTIGPFTIMLEETSLQAEGSMSEDTPRTGGVRIVKRPEQAVESVDKALQLIAMLREQGTVRVTDVAERLRVAPSTAYRLLATLAYRGYATHGDSRRYSAGPELTGSKEPPEVREVISLALPFMTALARTAGETVSLSLRTGISVRLVFSVESRQPVRVGDRSGTLLPVNKSSGGRSILATLAPSAVVQLYAGSRQQDPSDRLSPYELTQLLEELDAARSRGYARNIGLTEHDIAAIGMAVPSTTRPATFAVSIAAPIARGAGLETPETLSALRDCVASVAEALDRSQGPATPPSTG
jgi:IclR family acetate operon transcriptional repressor